MKRTLILLSLTAIIGTAAACGSSSTTTSPTAPSTPTAPASPTPTSPTPTPTTSAVVTVSIQGDLASRSFAPNPTTMQVGQSIAWHNSDSIAHTATGDTGSFNTNVLNAGATSAPVMMNTAGTFTYHCSIHPGMVGTITVQ